MTIISRESLNSFNLNSTKNFMLKKDAFVLLQIAAMLIQKIHTGLGITQAVQLSNDMFECRVVITWYDIPSTAT
jgi:hypothetical protein